MFRFLLLIPLSAVTVYFLYPLFHELGHAAATLLLGDRIAAFSLFPTPHVESAIINHHPGHVAVISLSGMLMPVLLTIPFRRARGYGGYTVLLLRMISVIACAVEFCIALQYRAGDVMFGDDIVLFLSTPGVSPWWAYGYTLSLAVLSFIAMLRMDPLTLIEDLAGPGKRRPRRSRTGKHRR